MKAKWSECRFRFVPESSGLGVINVQSLSCCRYTCVLRMLVGGRLGGKRGTWAGMGAAHLQTDESSWDSASSHNPAGLLTLQVKNLHISSLRKLLEGLGPRPQPPRLPGRPSLGLCLWVLMSAGLPGPPPPVVASVARPPARIPKPRGLSGIPLGFSQPSSVKRAVCTVSAEQTSVLRRVPLCLSLHPQADPLASSQPPPHHDPPAPPRGAGPLCASRGGGGGGLNRFGW